MSSTGEARSLLPPARNGRTCECFDVKHFSQLSPVLRQGNIEMVLVTIISVRFLFALVFSSAVPDLVWGQTSPNS